MRVLTDHIVEGDACNHQVKIAVFDEPGAGGAHHLYQVHGFDAKTNPSKLEAAGLHPKILTVLFQNGPIKENGVNGVTQEALLAIVIDRLRCFHAGPYSDIENSVALTHCEEALLGLQRRTRARIARGVEGTMQK